MKNPIFLIVIIAFFAAATGIKANNIQISNVSLEGQIIADQIVYVEFDISWENSWRTSAIPANHDAVWIFVKYRLASQEWHHMALNQMDFFEPAGSTIQVVSDGIGAFMYRDTDGSGNVSWENVRFKWDYGQAGILDDALLEVRVYGIEMVYIVEETFYVGDDSALYCFHQGNDIHAPYPINSETSLAINNTSSSDLWARDFIVSGTLAQEFPKGYDAFYCMKYEISQEQYVDFLNTLDREQQNNRTSEDISGSTVSNVYVMTNLSSVNNRNGIKCDTDIGFDIPVNFYCDYTTGAGSNAIDDGQNIACNCLNWPDVAAYLDWSGLRPMTELEFEKACRGPNPSVKGEYPWGTSTIFIGNYNLINDGKGDELIQNAGSDVGNCAHIDSPQGFVDPYLEGPFRCGIFAASSSNHTRVTSGSGYYGVMELGGNVCEMVVCIRDMAGRSFTGLHGNGVLDDGGFGDVDHWPGINGNDNESSVNGVYGGTSGVTEYAGISGRGGSYWMQSQVAITSSRELVPSAFLLIIRYSYWGGRGCRTAP